MNPASINPFTLPAVITIEPDHGYQLSPRISKPAEDGSSRSHFWIEPAGGL